MCRHYNCRYHGHTKQHTAHSYPSKRTQHGRLSLSMQMFVFFCVSVIFVELELVFSILIRATLVPKTETLTSQVMDPRLLAVSVLRACTEQRMQIDRPHLCENSATIEASEQGPAKSAKSAAVWTNLGLCRSSRGRSADHSGQRPANVGAGSTKFITVSAKVGPGLSSGDSK